MNFSIEVKENIITLDGEIKLNVLSSFLDEMYGEEEDYTIVLGKEKPLVMSDVFKEYFSTASNLIGEEDGKLPGQQGEKT
jgi:hypothetical protein